MSGSVQDLLVGAVVRGTYQSAPTTQTAPSAPAEHESMPDGGTGAAGAASMTQSVQQAPEQAQDAAQQADKLGNAAQQKKEDKELDEKSVSYMTRELNDLMARIDCDLEFKYHQELNRWSVKMIDKRDNKVLKEVPPEDLIKHMIAAKDWIGAFLDKNA